jgi:hypothetical protein
MGIFEILAITFSPPTRHTDYILYIDIVKGISLEKVKKRNKKTHLNGWGGAGGDPSIGGLQ